jgi:hypothetical protein
LEILTEDLVAVIRSRKNLMDDNSLPQVGDAAVVAVVSRPELPQLISAGAFHPDQ